MSCISVCSGHCLILLSVLLLLINSDWSNVTDIRYTPFTLMVSCYYSLLSVRAGGSKVISHWSGKIQAVCEAS